MTRRLRRMVVYYGVLTAKGDRTGTRHSDDRRTAERYEQTNAGHIIEHCLESGRPHRQTRPALAKAIQRAREAEALLMIPRFEPLARDPVFLETLWKAGVEFVACDNEYADQTTLPLLASVVIKQSQEISVRARASLAKRKRRKSLGPSGTPENLTREARLSGGERTRFLYSTSVSDELRRELISLRAEGKSLRQISAILYAQGHRSKSGRPWSHTLVRRLLDRCEAIQRIRAENRAKWLAKQAGEP